MPKAGDRAAPAFTSSSPWGEGLLLWAGKEESKEPGASQAWGWDHTFLKSQARRGRYAGSLLGGRDEGRGLSLSKACLVLPGTFLPFGPTNPSSKTSL